MLAESSRTFVSGPGAQARQLLYSSKAGVPGPQNLWDPKWNCFFSWRTGGCGVQLPTGGYQTIKQPLVSCHHISPEMELPCPSPEVGLSLCLLGWVVSSPSAVCSGCVCGGEGGGVGRQELPTAASHRPGVPSPSSVKWLKKYLSHKRNEARAAKGGVWASGLTQASGTPLL